MRRIHKSKNKHVQSAGINMFKAKDTEKVGTNMSESNKVYDTEK